MNEAIYLKLERPAILAKGNGCSQCGQTFGSTYWLVGYATLETRAKELCTNCKPQATS